MLGGPAKCIGASGFTAGCCMLHSRVGVPGLRQRAPPLWGTWGRGLPEGRGSSLLADDKSEHAASIAQEVASGFRETVLGTYLPRLPTRARSDSNVCDAITIDRESVPDRGDSDIWGGEMRRTDFLLRSAARLAAIDQEKESLFCDIHGRETSTRGPQKYTK